MKKIAMILMAVVMVFAAVPVNAVTLDNDAITDVNNDMSINSAMRTCPNCHQRVIEVMCAGPSNKPNYSDTTCNSGHPNGCMITDRVIYYSHGTCYNCGIIYDPFDYHVESCIHTGISTTIPFIVCNYR